MVDSLKVLDLERPIREADYTRTSRQVRFVPNSDIEGADETQTKRPPRDGLSSSDDRGSGAGFGLRRHAMKLMPLRIIMAQVAGNGFAAANNAVHPNG
jgi:hypothetical protein